MLPTGGSTRQQLQRCLLAIGSCPQALVQQALNLEREFARCMRSHGMPNWPDPTIDSEGRPVFAISISKDGFDPDSSQISAKADECQRLTGSPIARAVSP
jgi:hypothetical protein